MGFSITTDASGNTYTTGAFIGTADFDPGPGIMNLTSTAIYGDMFIFKLDPAGNLLWAKQYGGTGSIAGYSIALDTSGNVHATGSFEGTIDFDPGAGIYNLTATGTYDIFVCKADSSGNFIWAKQMGGTTGFEDNVSNAIAIDAEGNVYTTGVHEYTTDFDPGPGLYLFDSTGFFISKLDPSGAFVWAKQIVSVNVTGHAITIDNTGNVITAGSFAYTADFDPGAGTNYQTADGDRDIFILKLDASGSFIWMKQMGSQVSGDYGYGVTTDMAQNIYSTGSFRDTADFDPGPGTYNLTADGMEDIFISKLNASGTFICAAKMGGTGTDYGYAIALDAANGIHMTGAFMNIADFDPGSGVYGLISSGMEDIFISQLTDCSLTVGEKETAKNENIFIFPNPSSGRFTLNMKESMLLRNNIYAEIYNEIGEKVKTISIKKNEIDLSSLAKGIYLLKFNIGEQLITKKIIKN